MPQMKDRRLNLSAPFPGLRSGTSGPGASMSAWVPDLPCPCAFTAMYSWWPSAKPGRKRPIRADSLSAMPISLIKCSTKKPGAKSLRSIRGARLSRIQHFAAPPWMELSIVGRSRPALKPYKRLSHTPIIVPAMTIWLHILVCWPEPAGPWWTRFFPIVSRMG